MALAAVALQMGTFGCEAITRTAIGTTSINAITYDPNVPLALTTGIASLGIGKKLALSTQGGMPPYSYSIVSGGGSVTSAGVLTMPFAPALVTAQVMDALGHTATVQVTATVAASSTTNDPMFPNMPNLSQATNFDIDAPEAWGINSDCSSVRVAVLDTGADMTHPDLAANIFTNPAEVAGNGKDDDANGFIDDIHGWNFVANNNNPTDDNLHGTHVSGTIGAVGNNGIGVSGICWRASIVPLKFLAADGGGFNSDAIEGIDYAIGLGVKVLNASFGGGGFQQSFKDAIDRAAAKGMLFVAAAGNETNDNDATPSYPASYASTNVLSVAAVDSKDVIATFSNFGATSVHIAAPGVDILSTFPTVATTEITQFGLNTSYERISGTSMATPHVVGVAALLWSFNPSLTLSEVRSRILDRADVDAQLGNKVAGMKRLNARKTLYVP